MVNKQNRRVGRVLANLVRLLELFLELPGNGASVQSPAVRSRVGPVGAKPCRAGRCEAQRLALLRLFYTNEMTFSGQNRRLCESLGCFRKEFYGIGVDLLPGLA